MTRMEALEIGKPDLKRKHSFTYFSRTPNEDPMTHETPNPEDDHDYWPPYVFPVPPAVDEFNPTDASDVASITAQTPASAPESEEDHRATASADPIVAPATATKVKPARRAYGRSTTTAPIGKPLSMSHPADLDMFPAFMSRSALFGAFRPNCGGTHEGALKAAGEVSIAFTGPRLSMADKRVWEAIVRVAKRERHDLAQPFKARLAEIAEMAGYGRGQSRSAWAAIERLARSNLDATVYGAKAKGWLLMSATPSGRDATVRLDPGLVEPAFAETMLASMAGAVGDGIQAPLAQWLRDYFSTHKPLAKPLTLDYLRTLSGFPSQPKHFVAALEASMEQLRAGRPDLIASWSIDKGEGDVNKSANWTLLAVRGSAKPDVKHPAKRCAPSAPAIAPQAKRRGGPNL
ncbi:hypothetical protein HH212_22925 [Massilia forsythiae]|uniref:Uncharacterized protein n=1 Tax=Massilia forsythiae TaxID=2728020 RepID=A0A7Z2W0I1_9BURK|nr:hypothetical protein [Massilia forsythiae]QJE02520.1 hypothetical protein HH212_22925 [Massilia forsythiae]